jgi:hypothetical protein
MCTGPLQQEIWGNPLFGTIAGMSFINSALNTLVSANKEPDGWINEIPS